MNDKAKLQLELGKKINQAMKLREKGYSSKEVAKLVDLPESTLRMYVGALKRKEKNNERETERV